MGFEGVNLHAEALRRAITHGISDHVGQVAVGRMADLVLWKPENFGIKPELVLKSGVIAWGVVSTESFFDPAKTAAHSKRLRG